jgi:ribosomal protein L34
VNIVEQPLFHEPLQQPLCPSAVGIPCFDSSSILDSILNTPIPGLEREGEEAPAVGIHAIKRTFQPSTIVSYKREGSLMSGFHLAHLSSIDVIIQRKKRQHGFLARKRCRYGRRSIKVTHINFMCCLVSFTTHLFFCTFSSPLSRRGNMTEDGV